MSSAIRAAAIEGLPFVGPRIPRRSGESPRSFWIVHPSGDYARDCEHGSRLALEYLAAVEGLADGRNTFLQWIVRDMPAKQTGVEIGFLSVLGYALAHGRQYAEARVTYWEIESAKRAGGAHG
jgi:hypothetical protein